MLHIPILSCLFWHLECNIWLHLYQTWHVFSLFQMSLWRRKKCWGGKVHFDILLQRFSYDQRESYPPALCLPCIQWQWFSVVDPQGILGKDVSDKLGFHIAIDTSISQLTTWATYAKCLNIIRFHNQDGRQHPFRMSRVAHFQHFDKIPVCRRRRPTSPVLRKLSTDTYRCCITLSFK